LSRSDDKNKAFLALLLPLQGALEVYCRRMLRNRSDVEDVLQKAVMEAFARFDRYAEGTNFRAWIFRFVTLEAFNRNRKREPTPLGEFQDDLPAQPLEELPDDALATLLENPGPLMEHFEDHVVHALWQLTPSERAVLLLRAIGEFSYQEMHEILSIPLGSVMGYLSRARHKMRRSLFDFATQQGLCRRNEESQA
jgi:RNA polymerase sigma-70 factor (ECF subfamily)